LFFRQLLYEPSSCASYLFGCRTTGEFAVVDAHAELVDEYLGVAERQGARIAMVLETHVQADHISGLPALVERTGAQAYLPAGAGVLFEHLPLTDGQVVELGNDRIKALATPGHTPAHNAYLVSDTTRSEQPWLVLSGDSLLVGDAGRPDLHAHGEVTPREMAHTMHGSLERLAGLPDHLLLFPAHYGGSVCGRGLSATPVSTIGFERAHNPALSARDADAFAARLCEQMPPPPPGAEEIMAANRAGRAGARA
jgi:glyoxylase-like metal-dependent hydrolase (beta-lactamase superfamily II)